MILDLMLPELSGIEVCRRLRHDSDVPIIMLTAKDDVSDKVMGLDMGADDYMTKPFAIEELLARIRVGLKKRRSSAAETPAPASNVLRAGGLVLEPSSYTVTMNNQPINLTKKEFDLLKYLMSHKGEAVTRDALLTDVWGYDYAGDTNVVDVYIRYLRHKIDEPFGVKTRTPSAPSATCSASMTDRPKARRIRRKKDVSPAAPKPHGLPSTLSRIRLSLSFRIAAHFSFQLVRTFLPALLILTLAFAGGTLYLAERDISRLQCAPLSADGTIALSVLDDAEVTLLPEARTDGIIVGQSAYRLLDPEAIFTEGRYIVQAQHISGQSLLISLNLSRPLALYCGAAAALVITDLFRMFYFVWHRKRLQKSVLAPIRDITDMAATLSANNLSNRINIAGTKNELKDLATVINSMLDRIETSYNSQKQFVSDASHELRTPIAVSGDMPACCPAGARATRMC